MQQEGQEVWGYGQGPKTVWTTEMVSTLLDKHCDDFAASFELHRSAAQLSIIWGKIALAINIRLAEQATGNEVDVLYPPYWDDMVTALGNKAGLGHIGYAFDGSGPNEQWQKQCRW
ncbi:hypothetical protein H257_13091 [Aphanomyces astaci]|uniref:Uncharacterized protein n=1 Tax=Aphanomyces astaci TaxID=112090 RepID=W4FYA6_APHAT|nr:hypothetical protein H257_13091 [Aphanomyces astaci]ETV71633.1 hypothetical protein H257_13091 [Aphanomyces astaci]|eukprot:XP_009838821.1 hypothetical protein H257_13091 [Aphanomyces astaci]